MAVADEGAREMATVVGEGGDKNSVRLYSRDINASAKWTLHALGRWVDAGGSAHPVADIEAVRSRCGRAVERDEFYAGLEARRLHFGPSLRGVERVLAGDGEALAEIDVPDAIENDTQHFGVHPALLDAALQSVAALVATGNGSQTDALYLPVVVGSFQVVRSPRSGFFVHARAEPGTDGASFSGEVTAYDADGRVLFAALGLRFKEASDAVIRQLAAATIEDYLYEIEWQPEEGGDVLKSAGFDRAIESWIDGVPATLARRAAEQDVGDYEQFFKKFEAICAGYFAATLTALGWSASSSPATEDALATKLAIVPNHRRLFGRMLSILAETGVLQERDGCWAPGVERAPADPAAELDALSTMYPKAAAEVEIVRRCGAGLAAVLRGEQDPLELLFPKGDLATAEALYGDSPLAWVFNPTIADAIEALAQQPRPLRIIEIGAGTGGTTRHVLERIGDRVEYTFTDVSGLFTARARERFEHYGNVSYRELDIEHDPVEQGFPEQGFDVVIASNVLHATADIRETLRNVQRLMAPGAVLVVFEVFAPHLWFDLTVGMTPGWWKFADHDVRAAYPTLDAAQWRNVLSDLEFRDVHVVPGSATGDGVMARQGLVVARRQDASATTDGSWLILADRGGAGHRLVQQLEASGHSVCAVERDDYQALAEASGSVSLANRLAECCGTASLRGIVHLHALDEEGVAVADAGKDSADLVAACRSALDLAVDCAEKAAADPLPMWIVTRGAQSVTRDELYVTPGPATIWGLGRTFDREHPMLRFHRVDLDPSNAYDQSETLAALLDRGGDEREWALRDGRLLVPRVSRWRDGTPDFAASEEDNFQLGCSERGSIDNLEFAPIPRCELAAGHIEIRVAATALNFKDVLNVLGLYPGDPGPLGSECAGIVARVGADVTDFSPGDRVMAFVGGSFARYVSVPAERAAKVPEQMALTHAATVPVPFLTAEYALHHCGRLKSEDRVLIHAATGGVGLAAVQVAQAAGAEIFATAGTQAKRQLLRSLGVRYVYDSRSLAFAEEILADTDGHGVDVVLNSLADEFVDRSFDVVANNGRFLEIGKRGIWEPERVAALGKDIDYHVIDWGVTAEKNPDVIQGLFRGIVDRLHYGKLRPLPVRAFTSDSVHDAFRYMAQGRHIGKIALRYPANPGEPLEIGADGTYIVTGGFSGLGLETASWLVSSGARHLALVGRTSPTDEAATKLAELEAAGVTISIGQLDISDKPALEDFLHTLRVASPPIRGIVQSAGLLDDGVLSKQSWQRFETVFAPKVAGTWNLHVLTAEDPLDFFVLYSSLASMIGSPGQANHAAANAFMDSLVAARRRQGKPAVSINWGPWGGTGAAVRYNVIDRGAARGLHTISPAEGLSALETILGSGAEQIGVANVDWETFLSQQGTPSFFEALHSAGGTGEDKLRQSDETVSGWLQELSELPPQRQRSEILRFVRAQVVRLLGLAGTDVETDRPMSEMGLDSLLAVEIRNVLGKAFELNLPATITFDRPSIEQLADYIFEQKFAQSGGQSQQAAQQPAALVDTLDALSDDELDRRIAEKLKANE